MKVAAALLCDAATVREGVANILSAGINTLNRPVFPAPLLVTLFYLIEIPPEETSQARKLTIEVRATESPNLAPIARIEGGWEPAGEPTEDRLPSYLPVLIRLDQVPLPAPGYYEVRVEAEDGETRVLPFRAVLTS